MKTINISGTTSEYFKIGEGNNTVELRVIQGKLYFRNFGDSFKELLSNDADITLSPINWARNTNYSVGDLIYYNQSLFQVIYQHISGENFVASNDNYRRISNINNLTKIDVSFGSLSELNILSSNFIYLYGPGVGQFNLKLPDPTSISIGSTYTLNNNSNKIVNVYSVNNMLVTIINPNQTKIVILLDYDNNNSSWTTTTINNDQFLNIKNVFFQNNTSYKFMGSSGVFTDLLSGKYSFFDKNDADLNGDIFWASGASGAISCKIITFSEKIVSGDSPSYFCFFNTNDDLYIKNNTGVTREIVFHNIR